MVYRPKKITKSYGIFDTAKVKVVPKKGLMLLLEDSKKKLKISFANCPDYVEHYSPGTFKVKISDDEKQLLGLHPVSGVFLATVHSFPSKEDQPPTPKINTNVQYPYAYFVVLLTLLDEKVKGMRMPFMPRYNFGLTQEEVKGKMRDCVGITMPRSKYTPILLSFLDCTGAWDNGPIPYRENILPTLQKRILSQKKTFNIMIKDGWVSDVFAQSDLPDVESEEDDSMPDWE